MSKKDLTYRQLVEDRIMVEVYTITVWSFCAFYNTRRIGARGYHRAAPVSRYQSNAWSAKAARGVVRLAIRDAIYAPFYDRDRRNVHEDKSQLISHQTSNYDNYLHEQVKFASVVYSQKSEQYVPFTQKAEVAQIRIDTPLNVLEYRAAKIDNVEIKPIVLQEIKTKNSDAKFVAIVPNIFIVDAPRIEMAKTLRKEKMIEIISKFETKPRDSLVVEEVRANSPKYLPVPRKENTLMKTNKEEKIVNLNRTSLSVKVSEKEKVSANKKESLRINPVLNKVCVAKKTVREEITRKQPIINPNKIEFRVFDKNEGNIIDLNKIKLPSNIAPEFVAEKIAKKLEKMQIKIKPQKILDYSIFYMKEKQRMLVKKSFELWRILWARINGKMAMVIIDEATKMIIGYAILADMKYRKIISVLNSAMKEYGTPKAVVNYEQVLFCDTQSCMKNPGDKIQDYLQKRGIEYLASIFEESSVYLIACEFLEYVQRRMQINQKVFAQFVNMYNLCGIKEVGGGIPAFAYLQSA